MGAGGQRPPVPAVRERHLLSAWGLPPTVLAAFARQGLTTLYPWQAAALECGERGNNLVYCAPTSGGKSLVAEVLMLSRLHAARAAPARHGGSIRTPRALLVLPYLSIVAEKTAHLGGLLVDAGLRVRGYHGDSEGAPLAAKGEHIAVCSIEKANGVITTLLQQKRLHELVAVVVDEAHMLADPSRGPALEMLLSKLMYHHGSCNIQVVAMSATMAGLEVFATWLHAALFLTNYRPVPLTEHAVLQGHVFRLSGISTASASSQDKQNQDKVEDQAACCRLRQCRSLPGSEQDVLTALVAEVAAAGHSCLIFCPSRDGAEGSARMLAQRLSTLLGQPSEAAAHARAELVSSLRLALGGGSSDKLKELEGMMAAGVAYHHAGLTHQERVAVEGGYRSGALLVLAATSTLAAGVNLPARRVILRSLKQGSTWLRRSEYLQMAGRAGRAGQSAVGEAFLIANGAPHAPPPGEWGAVCALLTAPLPRAHAGATLG